MSERLPYTLILDLDDTIYKTRSLESKQFNPFFESIIKSLKENHSPEKIKEILDDLWKTPWDKVFQKHKLPMPIILEAVKVMEGLPLHFNIEVFPDYSYLKNLNCQKFLVTTGLTSLQTKKIEALNLEKDFEKIIINDPFKQPGSKLETFKTLMRDYDFVSETTYVIGDNPESELAAANALNMISVQILREGVTKGTNAKHYIQSFEELEHILNRP